MKRLYPLNNTQPSGITRKESDRFLEWLRTQKEYQAISSLAGRNIDRALLGELVANAVRAWKEMHACVQCGSTNKLEYHHKDPMPWRRVSEHKSWESAAQEMDRSILLCYSCHMKAHNKKVSTPS